MRLLIFITSLLAATAAGLGGTTPINRGVLQSDVDTAGHGLTNYNAEWDMAVMMDNTNRFEMTGAGTPAANGTYVYINTNGNLYYNVNNPGTYFSVGTKSMWMITNSTGILYKTDAGGLGYHPLVPPYYWDTSGGAIGVLPAPIGLFEQTRTVSNTVGLLADGGFVGPYINVGISNYLSDDPRHHIFIPGIGDTNAAGQGGGPNANLGGMYNRNYGYSSVILGGYSNVNYGAVSGILASKGMLITYSGGEDYAIGAEFGKMVNQNGVAGQIGTLLCTNEANTFGLQMNSYMSSMDYSYEPYGSGNMYETQINGNYSVMEGTSLFQVGGYSKLIGYGGIALGDSNLVHSSFVFVGGEANSVSNSVSAFVVGQQNVLNFVTNGFAFGNNLTLTNTSGIGKIGFTNATILFNTNGNISTDNPFTVSNTALSKMAGGIVSWSNAVAVVDGATFTNLGAVGNAQWFTLNFGVAKSASAGVGTNICTITFPTTYATVPRVMVTPENKNAAAWVYTVGSLYPTNATTASVQLNCYLNTSPVINALTANLSFTVHIGL